MANSSRPPKDPLDPQASRDPKDLKEQLEAKSGVKLEEWGRFAGHGIQFAIIIGLFAFGGVKLDDWLGTEPWLLLTMLFLGFIGATVSLVKQLPVQHK
jgi:F0F1-type ATP synthase assembly protein I